MDWLLDYYLAKNVEIEIGKRKGNETLTGKIDFYKEKTAFCCRKVDKRYFSTGEKGLHVGQPMSLRKGRLRMILTTLSSGRWSP